MTVANSRSEPSICISKNKSHCHCIIVWHREILLTTVPLVSYEFKEAPAAAKEAFILNDLNQSGTIFRSCSNIFYLCMYNFSPILYPSVQNAKNCLWTEWTSWIYDQRGSPCLPPRLLVGTLILITFRLSSFNHFLCSLLFVSDSCVSLCCKQAGGVREVRFGSWNRSGFGPE